MHRGKAAFAWALAVLVPLAAFADYSGVDGYEEYGQRIHDSQTVSPLGDGLFGDSVNLYDGQTSFEVTDVSIPGNSALPVALMRRKSI